MPSAKTLAAFAPQAVHSGKNLLRSHRAVPGLRRLQTGIAIAARGYFLVEISQQSLAPAVYCFAQAQIGIQLRSTAPSERIMTRRIIHLARLLYALLKTIDQPQRKN